MRVHYRYDIDHAADYLYFTLGDMVLFGKEVATFIQMPKDKDLLARAIEEAINKLEAAWLEKNSN